VREALETLPEATRLAVILHYVNGYSHAEVAQFLGTTEGAVKTRVSRGRARLREELAEMVGERLKSESGVFIYEATDGSGRIITGTTGAQSAAHVRRRLVEKGYRVTRMEEDRRTPEERLAEDGEPIERVIRAIMEQGLKDGAAEIRVALPRSGGDKPMTVSYLVEDVWHEVMAIPTYVWEPLRLRLAEMAGITLASPFKRPTGTIRFSHQGNAHALAVAFSPKRIRIDM
jgi:type II secretory ATPase GspE/PulE/Tfp pilus assembly ATPase PilB-like protein